MTPQIDANTYTNETLFDLLDVLPVPMYAYLPDGDRYTPLYMNRRCLDMLGAASLDDAIAYSGGSLARFVLPEDMDMVRDSTLRAVEADGARVAYECHVMTMDHRVRLARILSEGHRTADGTQMVVNLVIGLGVRPDTGDSEALDPVTGLISMHSFFRVMRKWRKHYTPERDGSELAVMYLDVVNFQSINIHDGIAGGDAFLKSVGDHLRVLFPASAISRFDVDHFALLMHADNLQAKADSTRRAILELAPKGVGACLGACVWDDHDLSAETICGRAKVACDVAKDRPGPSLSLYTEEMGESLEDSEYVSSNIEGAIKNDWIRVYYQPIVGTISGDICGMEALARWDDPTRGLLSPATFVGPLEDTRQIWKLDLCVIRQVVARIAERDRLGLAEIPISVNLSRTDFSSCDIFQEVDSLVAEHGIPRSTLRIEVTESAVATQDDAIVQALARFRGAGYEVWMDDFGSGYSSLNLLKDYDFDVLKLDMAFLRKDNERSRKIISSVISMDKRIGVRTLAEGVETREQADFLRKSGCTMMQGYLFGRPLPFDETLKSCEGRGIHVLDGRRRAYYDNAVQVDFLTETPLVLFDFHDSRFRVLQANAAASRMFEHYGVAGEQGFEDAVNEWNALSNYALDTAMRYADKTGEAGEQAVTFFGKEMLFRFRSLARTNGHSLIVARYYDVTRRMREVTSLAKATTSILEFYLNVFTLDLGRRTLHSLRYGNDLSGGLGQGEMPLLKEDGGLSDLVPRVLEEDEDRYHAFLDLDTLEDRLRGARQGVLRGIFRTMDADGSFRWMEHMLVFLQGSNRAQALYGIRPIDVGDLRREITRVSESTLAPQFGGEQDAGGILWDSLMAHVPLKVFWKDKDRRFCGASKSFLDYYGLDSMRDLLGKTDEDLRWHPIEQDYMDAELEVLRSGKVSRDVPGRCIGRGASHEIRATKWPVYRDGRISGLMGYFLEEGEDESAPSEDSRGRADERGGSVCGTNRFVDDYLSYEADYGLHRKAFGIVFVRVPEFSRMAKQCGYEALNLLESACEARILDVVGNRGTVAKLAMGRFGVLSKYRSRSEIQELSERVRKALESIRRAGIYDLSLTADVRVVYAETLGEFQKKLTRSLLMGTIADDADRLQATGDDRDFHDLLDSVPVGCYVLRPDFTILYWNREAERLLGYPAEDMVGKRCMDMPMRCSYVAGGHIPAEHCPGAVALATGKSKTMQMHMRDKDGTDVLVRNTLLPMKDNTGRIYELIAFFMPITEEGYEQGLAQQIYRTATRDSVTFLPGRRYMESRIDEALELHRRTGALFAVLFADVDDFHEVNNRYGHAAGDKALRSFGRALRRYGRRTDDFCRWGGDEFVGLLRLASPEDVEGAARRFGRIAEGCSVHDGDRVIECRVSVGIAVVRDGDDRRGLIDRADRYMYEAKRRHGHGVVTDLDATAQESGGGDEHEQDGRRLDAAERDEDR